jgi:hypothetical protein
MSKHKLQTRDKQTLKNTRDGLVERNIVTGEDVKVTVREAEQNLQTIKPQDDLRFSKAVPSAHTNNNHQHRQFQRVNESLQNHAVVDDQNTPTIQAQPTDAIIPAVNVESKEIRSDDHNLQMQSDTDRVFYPSPKSKSPQMSKRHYVNFDAHRNTHTQHGETHSEYVEPQPEQEKSQLEQGKSRPKHTSSQSEHGESPQKQNIQADTHFNSTATKTDINISSLQEGTPSKLFSGVSQSALQTETDKTLRQDQGDSRKIRTKHRKKRRHHSKSQSDAKKKSGKR